MDKERIQTSTKTRTFEGLSIVTLVSVRNSHCPTVSYGTVKLWKTGLSGTQGSTGRINVYYTYMYKKWCVGRKEKVNSTDTNMDGSKVQ